MKLSLVCVVAFAAAAIAVGSAERFLVTVKMTGKQREVALKAGEIRLMLDNWALVVADAEELSLLPAGSVTLGRFDEERMIVVLEKQTLEKDTQATRIAWRKNTENMVRADSNLKLLRVLPNSIVIEVLSRDIAALRDLPISGDTEILPMLPHAVLPVAENSQIRLQKLRQTFREKQRSADIPALLSQVNQTVLRDYIEYLSGEQSGSPILTRNSYSISSGVKLAADWIQQKYREFGFTSAQETFRTDMGPNVIATLRGAVNPDTYVVLGAHYDSRGPSSTSTTQRAPGANDDGSGTGALLQIAKIISDNNLRFRYSVILGSWGGEEQGLVGSRAYAQKSRASDVDILAMLQADMIAYRVPSEAPQAAFPDRNDDEDLTQLAIEVINTYVPEVRTCYTSACCSDHQSFTEQGYSATQVFERCGPIADDRYHNSADFVNRTGYDLQQLEYNTQAMLANLLVLAEAL